MRTRFRFFVAASLCSLAFGGVQAQEVKGGTTTAGAPMSPSLVPVTQAMLDGAAGDALNHLHPNSNYEQTRYYPATQIGVGTWTSSRPNSRSRPRCSSRWKPRRWW